MFNKDNRIWSKTILPPHLFNSFFLLQHLQHWPQSITNWAISSDSHNSPISENVTYGVPNKLTKHAWSKHHKHQQPFNCFDWEWHPHVQWCSVSSFQDPKITCMANAHFLETYTKWRYLSPLNRGCLIRGFVELRTLKWFVHYTKSHYQNILTRTSQDMGTLRHLKIDSLLCCIWFFSSIVCHVSRWIPEGLLWPHGIRLSANR